jgi:uncharacterized protein YqeY
MGVRKQLNDDVIAAMRSGDTQRRNTLRLLLAAVKQEEVDSRTILDDESVVGVLKKQAKQRRESIADGTKAGKPELVAQEEAELAIIEGYLPQLMSADEIRLAASRVITETGASGPQDIGRVMAPLMAELKGRADGKVVSEVVRDLLKS